nr:hypothetical protein CFP56_78647 [Quercus suber]
MPELFHGLRSRSCSASFASLTCSESFSASLVGAEAMTFSNCDQSPSTWENSLPTLPETRISITVRVAI